MILSVSGAISPPWYKNILHIKGETHPNFGLVFNLLNVALQNGRLNLKTIHQYIDFLFI